MPHASCYRGNGMTGTTACQCSSWVLLSLLAINLVLSGCSGKAATARYSASNIGSNCYAKSATHCWRGWPGLGLHLEHGSRKNPWLTAYAMPADPVARRIPAKWCWRSAKKLENGFSRALALRSKVALSNVYQAASQTHCDTRDARSGLTRGSPGNDADRRTDRPSLEPIYQCRLEVPVLSVNDTTEWARQGCIVMSDDIFRLSTQGCRCRYDHRRSALHRTQDLVRRGRCCRHSTGSSFQQ